MLYIFYVYTKYAYIFHIYSLFVYVPRNKDMQLDPFVHVFSHNQK